MMTALAIAVKTILEYKTTYIILQVSREITLFYCTDVPYY